MPDGRVPKHVKFYVQDGRVPKHVNSKYTMAISAVYNGILGQIKKYLCFLFPDRP